MSRLLRRSIVVSLVLVAGCKSSEKSAPQPSTSATATASAAASVEQAAPSATSSAADTGVLTMVWKVANAPAENVTVSLSIGSEMIDLGKLSAASDDGPGTIATCGTKNSGPTTSRLTCGGTPAYNFLTATIKDGNLVVTKTTGVDGEPKSEKTTELVRRPVRATSLKATGPATPAIYGNCRSGWVQKDGDAPCMRQCLKGTECKPTQKCELLTVKGLDGDHRVHACVPK